MHMQKQYQHTHPIPYYATQIIEKHSSKTRVIPIKDVQSHKELANQNLFFRIANKGTGENLSFLWLYKEGTGLSNPRGWLSSKFYDSNIMGLMSLYLFLNLLNYSALTKKPYHHCELYYNSKAVLKHTHTHKYRHTQLNDSTQQMPVRRDHFFFTP